VDGLCREPPSPAVQQPTADGGFLVDNYSSAMGRGQGAVDGKKPNKRKPGMLVAPFGKQLNAALATLRSVGAASGWSAPFIEHMVQAAGSHMEQTQVSQPEPHKLKGKLIMPGAVISDGSKGIKAAYKHWWPNVPQYGDYAHVYFLFAEGRFLDKRHPKFEHVLTTIIPEMHRCQTRGAWEVMSECLEREWKNDRALMECHQRLFARDHANPWYIGIAEVGGAMPSQNAQEVCSAWYVVQYTGIVSTQPPVSPTHPPAQPDNCC